MCALTFQYLDDLQCPHKTTDKNAMLDWILGYSIRLEYGDNGMMFYIHQYIYMYMAYILILHL